MLKTVFLVMTLSLVAGCTTLEESPSSGVADGQSDAASPAGASAGDAAEAELATSASELAGAATGEAVRKKAVVYRGNDTLVRLPAREEPVRFMGDDVSLNFEQAPLEEVMHAIMGDILALDYVVDHPVKGSVTLRTRTPIPRNELLGVLESLLKSNGVIMIRGDDGRYLVTGSEGGTRLHPSVSHPADTAAGYSTVIVPLQYISAKDMAEILKPVAEPAAFVRVDTGRNLLMLAGTRAQLDGWLDMVETFDVDMLKGMSVGLFPLENTSVTEATTALDALISAGGKEAGNLAQLIRVIPIDRLNSVMIVTPRAHYLDTAAKWIRRVDDAHHSSFDKRLHVYPVQNTTASRLAKLLNGIYGGAAVTTTSGEGSRRSRERDPDVAPGMSRETLGSTGTGGGSVGGEGMGGFSSGPSESSSVMVASGSVAGMDKMLEDVRVVADDENNALMIYASGMQYRLIRDALEQLDVTATQVIIEASIIEVLLTDQLRYGLEWTFKNGLGSDYDGTGLLDTGNSVAPLVPGFSYTVTNSIGDISAVLNALSQESLVNIISSPSVMVLDNHEAYIHVGEQIPTFDQQTESDGGRITQSVTYRDTGVKLTVRPSVNAGGLVTMDVEQSVTDVGDIEVTTNQRTFLERNIQSRVAVRSSESVVLGGLIRENSSEGSSGVPFLHKIPVVGGLFGTVDEESRRTELLVIITPRALYNESQLREVGEEMRSRVRFLELIEKPPQ